MNVNLASPRFSLARSNSQINSESSEFQQFLATEFTRMEQSIIDFANQQELFCNDFRRSLEAEVEKRHQDLSGLSANLGKMLETQLQVTSADKTRVVKYFLFMFNFPDGGKIVQFSDGPTLCGTKVGDGLFEEREKRGGQGVNNYAEVPH